MATSKEKRDELLATATPLMAAALTRRKYTAGEDWEEWLVDGALDAIDAAQALIHHVDVVASRAATTMPVNPGTRMWSAISEFKPNLDPEDKP